MAERVEVRYIANGTTCNDRFEAEQVLEVQVFDPGPDGGRAAVHLAGGALLDDGVGRPVSWAGYTQAVRVLRGPDVASRNGNSVHVASGHPPSEEMP